MDELGDSTPVLVLPSLPTSELRLSEEPGVPAGPRLFPVDPWLFALLELAPGAPPVPFIVAPLLSVVPEVEDAPPVAFAGEDVPSDDDPAEPPPELPLL